MTIGIDTWLSFHARMVALVPRFSKSSVGYKKIFLHFLSNTKERKVANEVLGNDRHERKFYKSIDQWLCQANQVMKHVTTLVNNANVPSIQSQGKFFLTHKIQILFPL